MTRVESPTSSKKKVMTFLEEDNSFREFEPTMEQINERIRKKINIFTIITGDSLWFILRF